jgi:hypothetical protein
MEQKPIPIAAEHAGDVEQLRILQRLLDARPHGVLIVLRLDDGDGDVWLIIKDIVGPLALATGGEFATDVDFASGKGDFFEELRVAVLACGFEGGGDVFGADVPLGEEFFVQGHGGRGVW